jgi:ankyrin repeat protein
MSEQAGVGGGNEGAPALGDVCFEGGQLLTFDGTSWVPLARAADGGQRDVFRLVVEAAASEPAPDSNQPSTAGNDSTDQ